jgi:hypothetical protein
MRFIVVVLLGDWPIDHWLLRRSRASSVLTVSVPLLAGLGGRPEITRPTCLPETGPA